MSCQHLGNSKVAQETGRYGDLQSEPVIALADVENVSRIRRASYIMVRPILRHDSIGAESELSEYSSWVKRKGWSLTLEFLSSLHLSE